MGEVQTYIKINPGELLGHASDYFAAGYRLVQISCTQKGGMFELNYSFDRDYNFVNLRFEVPGDYEVSSISPICFSALFYENEIQDLFGLKIKNMVIDYKGGFYRVKGKAPFRKEQEVKTEQPEQGHDS